MLKLDKIDKQLLNLLQKDSKIKISELSEQLNLSKTPIYERIKRFEKEGIISKYVAVVDKNRLGNSMVVFCSVSLDSQNLESIEEFSTEIKQMPEVIECYLMGGLNDFLLKVIVQDLQAYHKFSTEKLASLSNVSQIKSTFVLNEIKQSSVIPLY
ncbi:MAG: Lrp/AsnC family transcriptional regulator [Flavobacteriales bacterium]